jgi:tRNA threonylcarbamoyladenosine biosynthesis protein TsaE
MRLISNSPKETKNFAKKIAKLLLSRKRKKADILALEGNLGAGKTTFLQGLAKAFGIKEKVISPTFIIMRKYSFLNKKANGKENLYHFDWYRIKKPKEIINLGFQKIISNPQNIVAIEWAEKFKKLLPKNAFWLKFNILTKKKREILIKK